MDWLNYHHLYYFSVIAQEGGVAKAARRLQLTHSTLSMQLRTLEDHLGASLFERRGKRLVLTAFGADAAAYAAEIFRLGRELSDVAKGKTGSTRNALRVGVAPGVPKTLAHRLLGPSLEPNDAAVLIRQDEPAKLLESLAAGQLHMVLTNDTPAAPSDAKLHVHALGETEIVLCARGAIARRAKADFPASLSKVPLVLPPTGAPLRRRLDAWFAQRALEVNVKAEIEDAGLLGAFGAGGRGVFPVRVAVRSELEDLYAVQEVGYCEGLSEPYFAVTSERRVRHSSVAAIIEGARAGLSRSGALKPDPDATGRQVERRRRAARVPNRGDPGGS